MNRQSLGALIALNVALLAALAVLSLPRSSDAALGGAPARPPGDFVLIAGDAKTAPADQQVIYVMDVRSQTLMAMLFNSTAKRPPDVLDGRSVTADLASVP